MGAAVGPPRRGARVRSGADDANTGAPTPSAALAAAEANVVAHSAALKKELGVSDDDIRTVLLAGAFGNYIRPERARRIGLLEAPAENIQPAGNTALLGAKLALFNLLRDGAEYGELRSKVRHVNLNEDPQFHEVFVECMTFPANGK